MATPTKFIPFDQLVQMKGGELTPSEEYTRAYGGEGSYSPLLDYLLETGKPMSSITAPGGNTGNDPGLQAWIRNRVLAGRSPEDYIKSLNTGMGLGPTLQGNDQGGAWYDPSTGRVGYKEIGNDMAEKLIMAGLAGGVGALSGGFGLGDLFKGASSLGAETGAGFDWGMTGLEGGSGAAAATGGGMPYADAIEGLIDLTNQGFTGEQAIARLAEINPAWTQTGLEFLMNNPSQIFSSGGSARGGSALKSLLGSGGGKGNEGTDLLSILGKLGATGLGMYGSSQQSKSLTDLASKYQEYGAPSRARFEASMTPGFDPTTIPGYSSALDTSSKSLLARLSAREGNPFGNPGGLIEANKSIVSGTALPAINEYQRLNANTGFGSSMNAALNLNRDAIGSDKGIYDTLGYGINAVTNPRPSFADLYKSLLMSGLA